MTHSFILQMAKNAMASQAAVKVVHRWRTSVAPQQRPLSYHTKTDVVHFSTGRGTGDILF
jgi:hypothetical protein